MEELRKIALEILEELHCARSTIINEYSKDIAADSDELGEEIEKIRKRIMECE